MENLKELKEMLEKSFTKENRFYWIESMVLRGTISKNEAGWLCVELGILA